MNIAKNQKGLKTLDVSDEIWNSIKDEKTNFIVAFGSNGKGKSTIKELFQKENINKNFNYRNDEQSNKIYE
ncbi:MAG: hypothetical protein GX641_01115 [Mollicutes bacterium]|nr:hypothetical protein [Mollicutes bacterium]